MQCELQLCYTFRPRPNYRHVFLSSTLNTGICCNMLYSLSFKLYSKSVVPFRYIEVGLNTTTNCKFLTWKEETVYKRLCSDARIRCRQPSNMTCFVGDSRTLLRDHLATIIMIIYTRLQINVARERNHPARCNPGVIVLMYQMQV